MSATVQVPSSAQDWVSALAEIGFYTTLKTADQIHNWVASGSPTLVIKGAPYGGKTTLAEGIIRVLDGGDTQDFHRRMMPVTYSRGLKFSDLFFEWDGRKRNQVVNVMREMKESPERVAQYGNDPDLLDDGLLLLAIRESTYGFVLIDFYSGPLDDENADKALAAFIESQQIFIPELRHSEKRQPGQELKVIVTLTSDEDRQNFGSGHSYAALVNHGTWLDMDEIDRQYQLHVLSHVAPKLDVRVIQDLILFTERFNGLPGVNHRVTLGEMINVAEALEEDGVLELTAEVLDDLRGFIAKTHQCTELFDKHVSDIIASLKRESS
jgi:hypothetical protein